MTFLIKNTVLNNKLPHILLSSLMISAASFCMTMATAAPIYKIVDENTGQVTFTDRPQNHEQQVGKKVTEMAITTGSESSRSNSNNPSSSNDMSNNGTSGQLSDTQQVTTKPEVQVNYQLAIAEPSEERAYRRPAQNINVNVQIKPALQTGDTVSIYFDNKEVAQGLSASIATVDILPGAHSIKAVVKNQKGGILQQVTRTVYVIQNNTTLQNNKKIAKQLLAYQNLPWHQKVMLKMRQKGTANP
ncbi:MULTISPECIES: DUF4124 domain-containing protein [Psychrobacter]|uniref:DUF4124 domain-containing protein n=1 Tax=Psychrobacter alimentarius TaxID=261164 RepID=A0ABN4N3S6_9GAMM|nr:MULTISPECIES: DUF4124 domain-containing protein [Psychrobacter]AMT97041.1 hypothetical protein A3K91_1437 [Psychrobacter alimentarius]QCB30620.1 DUF4124 domain-containing protein [Psychrobacter sp. PAMC27889]